MEANIRLVYSIVGNLMKATPAGRPGARSGNEELVERGMEGLCTAWTTSSRVT